MLEWTASTLAIWPDDAAKLGVVVTSRLARKVDVAPLSNGALALVVGPSGAGKDTLMAAAAAALAEDDRFVFARRVITRASNDGSEDHDTLSPDTFARRATDGDFLLWWQAHGLGYAIPMTIADELRRTKVVVANVSRTSIANAEHLVGRVVVFHITAPVPVLAARIAARGREPLSEIADRLARQPILATARAPIVEINNDASVAVAAQRFTEELRRLADQTAQAAR